MYLLNSVLQALLHIVLLVNCYIVDNTTLIKCICILAIFILLSCYMPRPEKAAISKYDLSETDLTVALSHVARFASPSTSSNGARAARKPAESTLCRPRAVSPLVARYREQSGDGVINFCTIYRYRIRIIIK